MSSDTAPHGRHGNIARKFVLLTAAVGLLVFAASFAVYLTLEYDRAKGDIEEHFESIREAVLPALTISAWTANHALAQVQIEGIAAAENISYVELTLDTGQVLRAGAPVAQGGIRLHYPLQQEFEGRQVNLGTLLVEANLEKVRQRLLTTAITMFVGQGLETLLVVSLIALFFHLYVYRRLRAISSYAQALTPDTAGTPLHLRAIPPGGGDELDMVASSINLMRENLSQSLTELGKVNARLQTEVRERAQAQEALATERRVLANIIEGTSDAVFVKDAEGRYQRANAVVAQVFGKPLEDVLGRDDRAHFPPDDAARIMALDREVMAGDGPRAVEEHVGTSLGQCTYLTIKGPLRDESGRVVGLFGISRDITERKRMELESLAAKDSAEAANRAKSEFLANMSHEIRTPLNGVLGMLQLLQSTQQTPEQEEYANHAYEAGRRLLALLSDILDFSRVEAGKLCLNPAPFSLRESLENVRRVVGLAAGQKDLPLRCEVDQSVPACLLGDEARIRQIVFNLAGNAVKFTSAGSVEIQAWAEAGDGPDQVLLNIAVRDTGIGIPKEQQQRIFERFTQADGSFRRQHEGVGLGLAIVKRIVQLMDGRISLESAVDAGTRILVSLPLYRVESGECRLPGWRKEAVEALAGEPGPEVRHSDGQHSGGQHSDGPPTGAALNILLVEDEAISRMAVQLMLQRLGHQVATAGDGEAAVAAWARGSFDCVLMDIQMPGMDGVEATRGIRTIEARTGRPRTPILALTAYALDGDRETFLSAGMDDYVSKPVDHDELVAALKRAVL